MGIKKDKIYTTTTISSEQLERSDEVIKEIWKLWDNMPDEIDDFARERFLEIATRAARLHNLLRDEEKKEDLN